MATDLSVYIHIPFCVRKCRYCDFFSAPCEASVRQAYTDALIKEIREYPLLPDDPALTDEAGSPEDNRSSGSSNSNIVSIYIGGGTPSVLTTEQLGRILAAVYERYGIRRDPQEKEPGFPEVTLEINPGTDVISSLTKYRELGINRLSIGVQSFIDSELELLGRIHDAGTAFATVEAAKKAGFNNISLDLMCALPGQTMNDLTRSMETALSLAPSHLSVYSLIIEPGTPFYEMYHNGTLPALPDEDTERDMVHGCEEYLSQRGYSRYEISNYCLPGKESVHNTGYWTGRQYRGFGAGAASCIADSRFSNIADTNSYIRDIGNGGVVYTDAVKLSLRERMEEFMFLGLRMKRGVSADDFLARFGREIDEVYGDVINRHVRLGLIERNGKMLRLTGYGTDVSNRVMADYLF